MLPLPPQNLPSSSHASRPNLRATCPRYGRLGLFCFSVATPAAGRPRSGLWLLLRRCRCRCRFVLEVLIVENGIEYHRVGAEGLAAIARGVPKQQHVSLAQVRVHHDGMLGNRRPFIEKAVKQEALPLREAQDDLGPALNRN